MLKTILNLEGAQKLTEKEQKNIQGGKIAPVELYICNYDANCPTGMVCNEELGHCVNAIVIRS